MISDGGHVPWPPTMLGSMMWNGEVRRTTYFHGDSIARLREFAQTVLDVANELDHVTVSSRYIRMLAEDVPFLEWNETREGGQDA